MVEGCVLRTVIEAVLFLTHSYTHKHAPQMVFADGRKHELNVSTYQMAILMLFNETDSLSYSDIAEATQIPPADLKRSLQSLACVKVRRCYLQLDVLCTREGCSGVEHL